ncbi:hypothetical protein [Fibrella forsythiae]|uniref:Uncharacterized protein n=1 Tax=Fibrella forsythiae TaxID=2817061 RepID=A0ABS3JNT1_9BACT|nr:hypothetical protein [Fibrella forsythiae]MBO0951076.1 hypothetical protein [Fibrella forsythiae]
MLASTQGQPLHVSRDHRKQFNQYAVYLLALLERQQMRHADSMDRGAGHETLTETMPITIPEWQIRLGVASLITPARELEFNQFVLRTFRQRLRDEIALRMETTASIRKAAELTLNRWGVGEDVYPLAAALRHYNRHQDSAIS